MGRAIETTSCILHEPCICPVTLRVCRNSTSNLCQACWPACTMDGPLLNLQDGLAKWPGTDSLRQANPIGLAFRISLGGVCVVQKARIIADNVCQGVSCPLCAIIRGTGCVRIASCVGVTNPCLSQLLPFMTDRAVEGGVGKQGRTRPLICAAIRLLVMSTAPFRG